MAKHVKSITYGPKIEAVKDGRCTQTIRTGRGVSVGDEILFHGWSGRPYRSKWDWRKRVVVTECLDIYISQNHIGIWERNIYFKYGWKKLFCDKLAALDFIDPPTGEALRDVLFKLNGIPKEPVPAQIIRW